MTYVNKIAALVSRKYLVFAYNGDDILPDLSTMRRWSKARNLLFDYRLNKIPENKQHTFKENGGYWVFEVDAVTILVWDVILTKLGFTFTDQYLQDKAKITSFCYGRFVDEATPNSTNTASLSKWTEFGRSFYSNPSTFVRQINRQCLTADTDFNYPIIPGFFKKLEVVNWTQHDKTHELLMVYQAVEFLHGIDRSHLELLPSHIARMLDDVYSYENIFKHAQELGYKTEQKPCEIGEISSEDVRNYITTRRRKSNLLVIDSKGKFSQKSSNYIKLIKGQKLTAFDEYSKTSQVYTCTLNNFPSWASIGIDEILMFDSIDMLTQSIVQLPINTTILSVHETSNIRNKKSNTDQMDRFRC